MRFLTRWIGLLSLSIGLAACAAQPESAPTNAPVQTGQPVLTGQPTLRASATVPSIEATTSTQESQPDMATQEVTMQPEYAELLSRVRSEGTLRVIVLLNVPFKPEGELGSEEAVRQQHQVIADAQAALVEALEGTDFRVIDQFETVPQMVLTVDEKALQTLMMSGLVSTISEDSLSAPSS
jgi:hypothetical protein